ncbi:MAG: GNAT family N-acetyltransferase [Calditrichaeota bacterium]|nr:MAG: GNAT family N-acetyltransferase [Calditrichota bacterium]
MGENTATAANLSQTKYKTEIITSQTAFQNIQGEWNHLLSQSLKKSFFLTWEWQFQWWKFYQKVGSEKSLYIVLIRDEFDKIQAILPMYKTHISGVLGKKLELLYLVGSGHESSEYLDAIVSSSADEQLYETLCECLQQADVDGVHFSDLRDDSVLLPLLQDWARQQGLHAEKQYWKTCPFIPLQGNYEDFIGSLSKNMRYNVRRRTRNLEKNHKVVFRKSETAEDAEKTVGVLYELHRKRWETKEGESKFDDPLREKFHAIIAAPLLDGGYLRFYILEVDDVPVATLYCFAYDGHVYYYQAGMEPELEKKSIGMVVMGKAIEASFEEGAHEYDFLRGLEDYKFRWTDKTRDTHILEIAFSKAAASHFGAQAKWRGMKKQIKKVIKK